MYYYATAAAGSIQIDMNVILEKMFTLKLTICYGEEKWLTLEVLHTVGTARRLKKLL